jgi:hypothetical protein
MSSSSHFRVRAEEEMKEIQNEILDLATDRDIYWKVQREVIQRNHRLLRIRSPFFDMINDAMRMLLRLVCVDWSTGTAEPFRSGD